MMRNLDIEVKNISSDTASASYPELIGVCHTKNISVENIQRTFIAISRGYQSDIDGETAIVTTGMLNSPDKVFVNGRQIDERSFELHVEINRYDGPMAANVPWQAFITMQLGILKKGTYELIVSEQIRQFKDIKNPVENSLIASSENAMKFICD